MTRRPTRAKFLELSFTRNGGDSTTTSKVVRNNWQRWGTSRLPLICMAMASRRQIRPKAKELSSQFYGKPLMAERAQAALDQLLKTGLVDESKVAAIGFCFGGSTSLALAYTGAPLAGVVTFHGGLIPGSGGRCAKDESQVSDPARRFGSVC